MKLVKDSWNVSFARVNINKKAVLNRGWGPRASELNISTGLAGTLVECIIVESNRESHL